jgi:CMP-N,N'-diacetyllegionaminic acid synthase
MLNLDGLIIDAHETLRIALQRMTQNHKGILFVCDYDNHLVGVLSDGDVRRTLLDEALLLVPIGKVMNTDPVIAASVAEATDLMSRFSLVAVPVVGTDGRIVTAVVETGSGVEVLRSTEAEAGHETLPARNLGAVAIIPARGGSKRIPRKNLARVAGRSLIDWAILAAKRSKHVGHIIVSTEDDEIADAARALGIEVPWLRPAELAQDTTPSLDVILHAATWALETLCPSPEWGLLLEPTAALRSAEQVDQALDLLVDSDADSVISVCEVPHTLNPEELLQIDDGVLLPYCSSRTMDTRRLRNQHGPAYVQNGLVYAFRIESVIKQRSLYGRKTLPLITGWEFFLDIDTPADLQLADFRMRQVHFREQIT